MYRHVCDDQVVACWVVYDPGSTFFGTMSVKGAVYSTWAVRRAVMHLHRLEGAALENLSV